MLLSPLLREAVAEVEVVVQLPSSILAEPLNVDQSLDEDPFAVEILKSPVAWNV
jgi:hypothetical protein